jgi:tetratricopeptide (TPR) repeat protein
MSPRLRVSLLAGGAAVVAAVVVVGVTLATRQTPPQPRALSGKPGVPNVLPTPAAGRIRAAFRAWPHGSLDTMQTLGREYKRDPVVQLYLGVALLWSGYDADAATALQDAKRLGRDTSWEVQADNLLHPEYFTGYPVFVPTRPNALLVRGSALQREDHQHSAERLYLRAARQRPGDDEAQVAAAVGRFDKSDLSASFSRLGPLTQRFPRSQAVRFYLGYLLAWTGQRDAALAQLRRAAALDPKTKLGLAAERLLTGIEKAGTRPPGK